MREVWWARLLALPLTAALAFREELLG